MILTFDFASSVPLYTQLRNQIVMAIASGDLKPGDRLPTIRALAQESGINMMTVSRAYQNLKMEGYIITDRRSGATVAQSLPRQMNPETIETMKLCISELKAAGMDRKAILAFCEKLCEEVEK
ncbi:MAG: GntR family transcriptional regulator [Solobacterium sp.]|nr:GntR family transcriptional regulator [Solobacterium sp.]